MDDDTTWGQGTWFDFTIPDDNRIRKENLRLWMENHCDRGAYAEETGEFGYKHLQCRVAMKTPQLLQSMQLTIPNARFSYCTVRNFDYIKKTAKSGGTVWTTWDEILRKYRDMVLSQWQTEAFKMWREQNDRQILCIVDLVGNSGKTWFANFLEARYEGIRLPVANKGKDLVQMAMAESGSGGYIIDVPRSGTLKEDFWAGIEQIKSGLLYETRYAFTRKWIEQPKICVITNKMPDKKALSADRWQIMKLVGGLGGSLIHSV